MEFHIRVSSEVPARVLPEQEQDRLPFAFSGDLYRLKKTYPVAEYPSLVGLGHRIELGGGRIVHYLSLWIKDSGSWVAVEKDPRLMPDA